MMIEFINRPMRLFSLFFIRRQFLTFGALSTLTEIGWFSCCSAVCSHARVVFADEKGSCDPPAAPAWELSTSG